MNRKPKALKLLRGTYRPSRGRSLDVEVTAAHVPPPPKDLAAPEVEVWRELARAVEPLRTFTLSDLPTFKLAVTAVTRARRLAVDPKASINQQLRSEQHAMNLLGRFGLNPAERERAVVSPAPASGDPADEFAIR